MSKILTKQEVIKVAKISLQELKEGIEVLDKESVIMKTLVMDELHR